MDHIERDLERDLEPADSQAEGRAEDAAKRAQALAELLTEVLESNPPWSSGLALCKQDPGRWRTDLPLAGSRIPGTPADRPVLVVLIGLGELRRSEHRSEWHASPNSSPKKWSYGLPQGSWSHFSSLTRSSLVDDALIGSVQPPQETQVENVVDALSELGLIAAWRHVSSNAVLVQLLMDPHRDSFPGNLILYPGQAAGRYPGWYPTDYPTEHVAPRHERADAQAPESGSINPPRSPFTTGTASAATSAPTSAPTSDRQPGQSPDDPSAGGPIGGGKRRAAFSDEELVEHELRRARSMRELAEIEARRAVWSGHRNGLSQRRMGDLLGRSQPDVGRTLKKIEQDPSIVDPSPREFALRRAVGQYTNAEMLSQLLALDFQTGEEEASPLGSGYIEGSWDQVRAMRRDGLITLEEWGLLFRANFGEPDGAADLLLPEEDEG